MTPTQKLSLYLAVLNVVSALTIFGSVTMLIFRFDLSLWWYAGALMLYALVHYGVTDKKE